MRRHWLFFILALSWGAVSAHAQLTPRATHLVRGGHEVAGNALLRCPSGTTCVNNNVELVPIDVDPLALGDRDGDGVDDTTMSSAATLTLPEGARVIEAKLYVAVSAAETSGSPFLGASWAPTTVPVLFARTGGRYVELSSERVEPLSSGLSYQATYDVTTHVSGSGEYWVADPIGPSATHRFHRDALWVLTVIYDDGSPMRFIRSWTGAHLCAANSLSVPLEGFRTPASGAVAAAVTIWGQDGHPTILGDSLRLGTQFMSNALNPANNVGNGTISTSAGAPIPRNPSANAHLEPPDIDTFDASAAFSNNQTAIDAVLACEGDGIIWYGLLLGFDVLGPDLRLEKRAVVDVDRALVPGDAVVYELLLENRGEDDAADAVIEDTLPTGLTFVRGSLEVEIEGVFVARTDDPGDDAAEIAGRTIRFRVGAGASASSGGTLAPGASARVRFRATVDRLTEATTLVNRAEASARPAWGDEESPRLLARSEDTEIAARVCVPDEAAETDPGCDAVRPACAPGASEACVECVADRHCTDGFCAGGRCVRDGADSGAGLVDASVAMDGAVADAGVDAGPTITDEDGCGCNAARGSQWTFLALLGWLLVRRRGRRDIIG